MNLPEDNLSPRLDVSSSADDALNIRIDPLSVTGRKSQLTAGLLGVLFGGFGAHRFYLRYPRIGLAQLLLTLSTLGVGGLWGWAEGVLILFGWPLRDGTGKRLCDRVGRRWLGAMVMTVLSYEAAIVVFIALSQTSLLRVPMPPHGASSIELVASAPSAPRQLSAPEFSVAPPPPPAIERPSRAPATVATSYPIRHQRPTQPILPVAAERPFATFKVPQPTTSQFDPVTIRKANLAAEESPAQPHPETAHIARAAQPAVLSARQKTGVQTDRPPEKIAAYCPEPIYPAAEFAAQVEGSVDLAVRVGRDGRVSRASVYRSSGRESFDLSALRAVKLWRFHPALIAGIPVTQDVLAGFDFKIERSN